MIEFVFQNLIISALVALAGLGLIFGALLGFAAEKFKIGATRLLIKLIAFYPRPNVANVGFRVVVPMQNQLLMVTQLINALLADSLRLMLLQICLMSLRPN